MLDLSPKTDLNLLVNEPCVVHTEQFKYVELTHRNEVSAANSGEDLVYGGIGGQGTVDDGKVSLQSLWDVIPATTGMDHGSHHCNVHYVDELSRLLQVVESLHLHHLSGNFIGHLYNDMINYK